MASCVNGGNVGAGVFVTVGGRGVRVLVGVTIVGVDVGSVGVAESVGGIDVPVERSKGVGGAVLLGLTVTALTCAAACASASG